MAQRSAARAARRSAAQAAAARHPPPPHLSDGNPGKLPYRSKHASPLKSGREAKIGGACLLRTAVYFAAPGSVNWPPKGVI
eukprot:gene10422-biopygen19807